MRIVFLDRSTFSASIAFPVARLAAEWQEHARTASGEVLTHAAEATAVVTNKVKLPAVLLEKLPRLKLVAVAATGVDHVDLDAPPPRGRCCGRGRPARGRGGVTSRWGRFAQSSG